MTPRTACTGGTFDPFHEGHEALLSKAFEIADEVICGLTTDEYVAKVKDREVTPYEERKEHLESWAKDRPARLVVVPLYEAFGPAPFVHDATDIVVSEETRDAAKRINELREKWDREPLDVHVVDLVEAKDGDRISSTRIAAGEIDAEGNAA